MKDAKATITCDQLAALAADAGGTSDADLASAARTPDERAAIVEHLADCAACRSLVHAQDPVRRRLAALAAIAPAAPPLALQARLRDSLRARSAPPPERRRTSRVALLGAGAALAAAAAGIYVVRDRSRGPVDDPSLAPAAPVASEQGENLLLPATATRAHPGRRFRPLGWLESERPVEAGHVAQVELGAEVAAHLGWPLLPELPGPPDRPERRVRAEVLYGEDGLARAVRFLPASFTSTTIRRTEQRRQVIPVLKKERP